MIKVLVAIPSGRVSGLQNAALAFFAHLDPRQFSPFFLVSRWNDGAFVQQLQRLEYPYRLVHLGFLSKQLQWDALWMTLVCVFRWPQLCWRLWRVMRHGRFDLVYVTGHHLVVQMLPMLLLWRKPVIWHEHDPSPPTRFHRQLYRVLDRVITRYVAISDSVRVRLLALGVPAHKIERIHNGIDLSPFEQPETGNGVFRSLFGWTASTRIVAMTGQMIEVKGHLDFIESASLIPRTGDVKFLISGALDGEYSARLRRRVEELKLTDRVVFCGPQPHSIDVFRSVDVLVMPSRHEEGFGLVVAEAMAAGKPVVITRSGGAVELVRDGQEGFVVARGQPALLAAAISRLLDDPQLAIAMGAAGRGTVRTQFDIRQQAQALGRVFSDVAAHGI